MRFIHRRLALRTAPALLALGAAAAAHAEDRAGDRLPHRLVLQVNSNDAATMTLALNNASNVEQYYRQRGEPVQIEIVTFGPGLHMLRDDTSPVKDRLRALADKSPAIAFSACGNTRENMAKTEQKAIPIVGQATVVPSGVVRLIELQEQGWAYVRP